MMSPHYLNDFLDDDSVTPEDSMSSHCYDIQEECEFIASESSEADLLCLTDENFECYLEQSLELFFRGNERAEVSRVSKTSMSEQQERAFSIEESSRPYMHHKSSSMHNVTKIGSDHSSSSTSHALTVGRPARRNSLGNCAA
jgi:hypothetical protein